MTKLFPLTSFQWLLGINIIYLVFGLLDVHYQWWPTEYVQAVWIVVLSLPLWIAMPRIVDMDTVWEGMRK